MTRMETVNGSPYRISLESMQLMRRRNLGNYLLRLDLTKSDAHELAAVSAKGCGDALMVHDTDSALVFARYWAMFSGYVVTAEERETILTADTGSTE